MNTSRNSTWNYTCGAELTTFSTLEFTYGRIEMRAKVPRGRGIRFGAWLTEDTRFSRFNFLLADFSMIDFFQLI